MGQLVCRWPSQVPPRGRCARKSLIYIGIPAGPTPAQGLAAGALRRLLRSAVTLSGRNEGRGAGAIGTASVQPAGRRRGDTGMSRE